MTKHQHLLSLGGGNIGVCFPAINSSFKVVYNNGYNCYVYHIVYSYNIYLFTLNIYLFIYI